MTLNPKLIHKSPRPQLYLQQRTFTLTKRNNSERYSIPWTLFFPPFCASCADFLCVCYLFEWHGRDGNPTLVSASRPYQFACYRSGLGSPKKISRKQEGNNSTQPFRYQCSECSSQGVVGVNFNLRFIFAEWLHKLSFFFYFEWEIVEIISRKFITNRENNNEDFLLIGIFS